MSPRHSSPCLDVDGSQVTNPASSSPISHSDQAESSNQQKNVDFYTESLLCIHPPRHQGPVYFGAQLLFMPA